MTISPIPIPPPPPSSSSFDDFKNHFLPAFGKFITVIGAAITASSNHQRLALETKNSRQQNKIALRRKKITEAEYLESSSAAGESAQEAEKALKTEGTLGADEEIKSVHEVLNMALPVKIPVISTTRLERRKKVRLKPPTSHETESASSSTEAGTETTGTETTTEVGTGTGTGTLGSISMMKSIGQPPIVLCRSSSFSRSCFCSAKTKTSLCFLPYGNRHFWCLHSSSCRER